MEFIKAHGAGNDFVLLPDLEGLLELQPEFVRAVCARHHGLGADGVIRLAPPRVGVDADVFMDYVNADGSVAEMCGNGVRCVAKFLGDRGLVDRAAIRVDTRSGVRQVEVVERHDDGRIARVRVDMGPPVATGSAQVNVSPTRVASIRPDLVGGAVTAEHRVIELTTVSMGNPHAVLVVDDLEKAPVASWGPVIEQDATFPEGTNVEFIAAPAADVDAAGRGSAPTPGGRPAPYPRIDGRVWERGVGETMASGSGAAAMAVAASLHGLVGRQATVALPGGEIDVEWTEETLYLTGPATEVAEGTLDEAWLATMEGLWLETS